MRTNLFKPPFAPIFLGAADADYPHMDGTSLYNMTRPSLLLLFLLMLWFAGPAWIQGIDETAGNIDQSIWLLVVLGLICFLIVIPLSWWLLKRFLLIAGLPSISFMVSQFYSLTVWQQLSFYWASFALLLLSASLCLAAVC